jgi:methionine-rich copper-binding protein CopC
MESSLQRRFICRTGSAALFLTALLVLAGPARADLPAPPREGLNRVPHLRLERSDPAADTVLRASPTAIRLFFSEGASLPVTRLTLTMGTAVLPTGKATRATGAGQPIVFPLPAPLAPGRYTVKWKTMSADGHAVSGTFAFTVASAR